MTDRENDPGWAYYAAIVLFMGVLVFAVLGLVRSSSLADVSTERRSGAPVSPLTPSPAGRIPTPQIPPLTPSVPSEPPSRTFLHPPPGLGATAPPEPDAPPRR